MTTTNDTSLTSELVSSPDKRLLKAISIQQYKSIKNLQYLELGAINILIGANGAGKSNLLQFFQFFKEILRNNLSQYVAQKGGAERLLWLGKKHSQEIKFMMNFNESLLQDRYSFDQSVKECIHNSIPFYKEILGDLNCPIDTSDNDHLIFGELSLTNDNSLIVSPQTPIIHNIDNAEFDINKLRKEGILRESYLQSKPANSALTSPIFMNLEFEQYHFHDTSSTSLLNSSSRINDNYRLRSDGRNIASIINKIFHENKASYNKIISTIKMVIPDFFDFHPKMLTKSEEFISFAWQHKHMIDEVQPLSALSDGSQRFICLTVLLLQPLELIPDLVIIDEPELGLHPKALLILSEMIQSISLQKQFIIATQSSQLLDLFSADDIIVTDKNDDGSSNYHRLTNQQLENWLKEYNLSELWDMGILGGDPW